MRRSLFVLLLTASAGCALETQAVGPGNGGLEGRFADAAAEEGAGDETVLDTTSPDTTSPDTGVPDTPNVIAPVQPQQPIEVVEPSCTPGTERSTCPGTSCDPVTLTCTTMELASRSTCETCFTDSNCASADNRCVYMTHEGAPFPDERMGFCLQVAEPVTVDGRYLCEPPFAVPLVDRESPSGGRNQTYCGIHEKITTCLAVRAFHAGEQCPGGRDEECPAGGLCRAISTNGKKTEFACTYACTDPIECSTPVTKINCAGYCGG